MRFPLLSFFALVVVTLPVLAQNDGVATARSITGEWRIASGRNPGSKTDNYRGTVRIAAKDNSVIAMTWAISGATGYAGIGFTNGKILAAGYTANSPFGVAIYDSKPNGEFVGAWTGSMTKGEIGYETIQSTGPGTGIFKITKGVEANGQNYTGTVSMEKQGDTYKMVWKVGTATYTGVGIRVGDSLIAGWTTGKDVGVVFYELNAARTVMEGQWTGLGATKLGTERLER